MEYKRIKYKAGMPLSYDCITRDGRKANVSGYNRNALPTSIIVGWVDGISISWDENGNFKDYEHDFDLFALVECETKYINIHEDSVGRWADETLYDLRSVAEENGSLSSTYNQTIEIEL